MQARFPGALSRQMLEDGDYAWLVTRKPRPPEERGAMDPLLTSTFVATAGYLFLKMQANSCLQLYARLKGFGFVYPEDRATFGGPSQGEGSPYANLHMRAAAAWRNDLENIPLFLFIALGGLLAGMPGRPYAVLLAAYCLCRSLHTVCLVRGLQPWRFLFFLAGQVVTGILVVWSLRLVGF